MGWGGDGMGWGGDGMAAAAPYVALLYLVSKKTWRLCPPEIDEVPKTKQQSETEKGRAPSSTVATHTT